MRLIRSRRLLLAAAGIILLVVWAYGRRTPGDHAALRRLPGTESAAAKAEAISLSPDNRWLVFLDYTATSSAALQRNAYRDLYRIASLDLETGRKTIHRTTDEGIELGNLVLGNVSAYGIGSWRGRRFMVCAADHRRRVLLDPVSENFVVDRVAIPAGDCSDCGRHRLRVKERSDLIVLDRDDRQVAVIPLWKNRRLGQQTSLTAVRLSPNDRYLVYAVQRNYFVPFVPGKGYRYTVRVKDLDSGRDVRLAEYTGLGNAVWSSDSRRLYFAADDIPPGAIGFKDHIRGIYEVDMSDLFGK